MEIIICLVFGFLAGVHLTYYRHDLYSNPKMNRSARVDALESELENLTNEMKQVLQGTQQ